VSGEIAEIKQGLRFPPTGTEERTVLASPDVSSGVSGAERLHPTEEPGQYLGVSRATLERLVQGGGLGSNRIKPRRRNGVDLWRVDHHGVGVRG
jgi:hypothetical protein